MILIPYVEANGFRTIPDDELVEIFDRIILEGLDRIVFYSGNVRTARDFIFVMKSQNNLPVFVRDKDGYVGFAWLNNLNGNNAMPHFCFFKGRRGELAIEAGKKILQYWFSFPGEGGPLFDVLVGMVPDFNTRAIEFVKKLGAIELGSIPKLAYNGFTQGKHGMTMLYYLREQHGT